MRSKVSTRYSAGDPPELERQFFATGFQDVDRSGDTTACQRCLDLISGIPFFRKIKEDSFRIIAESAPKQVLDAGCGAGTDLVSLASCLPTGCQICGMDASGSLLARADERTRACRDHCFLVRGDITNIPCRSRVFDACRVDRVLQHIHDPVRGVRELARVIAPGGILVAFDNDWDTFSISLDDQDLVERLSHFWRDSFAAGRVGHDLPRILSECGFRDIQTEPRTLVLTDRSVADKVFDLSVLLDRAEQTGVLKPAETAQVRVQLQRMEKEGTFYSGYTGFLVYGKMPG